MIFGLGFATFLTLILVPVMYLLNERMKNKVKKWKGKDQDQGVNPKKVEDLIEIEI